ncbi:MAG: hypothetical protein IJM17_06780 [Firmicutes bacterium]|nr:hypothetical protein [Bacillota bacterium]
MLPLIILKIMADLAFYYSVAGFFAVKYGADPSMIMAAMAIQTLAFTLSFLLEEKGPLRFVPLALCGLVFALPGLCLAFALIMLPPTAYLVMSAKDKTYYPSWASSADLLSLYLKVLAGLSLMIVLTRGFEAFAAISVPCAIISLCACVMLTRSMRHDIDVYSSPVYQLVNAGTAAVLVIVSAAVSSKAFRSAVGSAVGSFYLKVIVPILLFFTHIIVYLFYILAQIAAFFLRLLHVEGAEVPDYQTIYGESAEEILETEYDPSAHPLLRFIATAIVVGFALWVGWKFFRYMQGMLTRKRPKDTGERETRTFIGRKEEKSGRENEGLIEKLRAQYRSFLKEYKKKSLPLEKHMTSENVLNISTAYFDLETGKELRELYIRARYGGLADRDDVARAKELVKALKKGEDD